jgi:hypothetical protein
MIVGEILSQVLDFLQMTIIYKTILNNNDMENLQIQLNRLVEWASENEMIINPTKSKAICFTKTRVTEPLNYSLRDIVILEARSLNTQV